MARMAVWGWLRGWIEGGGWMGVYRYWNSIGRLGVGGRASDFLSSDNHFIHW